MCPLIRIRHAKSVAYLSRSNGWAEVAGRQLFEKLRKIHITNPRQNWFEEMWPALKAHNDTPNPAGLSPHQILIGRDPLGRGLPLSGDGMSMDARRSSRGKKQRRCTSASSSTRSMFSVRSPPRAQQHKNSGWETRCG